MTLTKLAIYDFDGTLFRSPEQPEGWTEGWWGNIASLNPPVVPEKPGAAWWNGSVVQRAKQDISDGETIAVLLTGRLAKKFTARVKDLLSQVGLKFDQLFLAPGGSTETFKLRVIGDLLKEYPTITGVDIWEDRAPHLAKFADFVESHGKAAFPHLITVTPHEPEGLPSAAKVAGRYLAGGRVTARDIEAATRLYHISGWGELSDAKVGDTFTLKPGRQNAEGLGVYFSEGAPVKVTTAEGTAQSGATAVVETEVSGTAGWWRTKPSIARKFNRPITWHTDGKSLSCKVESVGNIPVSGAGSLPLLKSECSFSRVAAKYQSKKKIETKDGDEATVYEYGPRQIANRHREKAERVEHLRKNITDLRARVREDLKSDDPMTQMTALAVALMDRTCERVGNDDSAEDGHYGVTGWLKKHITIRDGKATIKYVGKSGVKHEKTVDDGPTVTALKALCDGRDADDAIFDTGEAKVSADEVNDYLAEFDVTAKDIRGYRANDEMCKALRAERAKGPRELPRARKEKDEILKAEFERALEHVAEVVGHEPSTLRSQYLVPGLEDQYVHDGTVIKSLKVASAYPELPVSNADLPSQVRSFFAQHAWVFREYPELWVKGGAARNALLSVLTGTSPAPPRDIDLVLVGESGHTVCLTLADALGLDRRDVECIPSLSGYFSSRDLGVNEVLLRPDRIMFTENARRDVMKGHASPVRPEYEQVTPRVALRGVLIALREGLKIHPLLKKGVLDARPFDLLMHLFKAFESGVEDRFFNVIRENQHLRGTKSAERALFFLLGQVRNFRFTDSQSRLVQQLRREEEYGNRYATKSDAEREDEAVEKLVKPSPKAKPPRHDLRNERVEAERDPDLDTTDDDLSLNFKKVASRSLVAVMASRIAARYLWAKGVKPSSEGDDAEAEFLKSVEGKLFRTPKSDKEEGVSYSRLKKIDPEMAKEERAKFVSKAKTEEKSESDDGDGEDEGSEDESDKGPATKELIDDALDEIKASVSSEQKQAIESLFDSVLGDKPSKSQVKNLMKQFKETGKAILEDAVKASSASDYKRLLTVPEDVLSFDGKKTKLKSTTFNEDEVASAISANSQKRDALQTRVNAAKKSVRDAEKKIEEVRGSTTISEESKAKQIKDLNKEIETGKKSLVKDEEKLESQNRDLARQGAYFAKMQAYLGHLTDPSKGSKEPDRRLSEAVAIHEALPSEVLESRAKRTEEGVKSLLKERESATDERTKEIEDELNVLNAERAATRFSQYTREDGDKSKGDSNDPSSYLVKKFKHLGVDDPHVKQLLVNGTRGEEGRKALWNLSAKLNDEDLVEMSGDKSMGDILLSGELDPVSAQFVRKAILQGMLLKQPGSKNVVSEVESLAKSTKQLADTVDSPSVWKGLKEWLGGIAQKVKTPKAKEKLDRLTEDLKELESASRKKPKKPKKSLMQQARDFVQKMDITPEEKSKKLKSLGKMSPDDIKAMMASVLDEEDIDGESPKVATSVHRARIDYLSSRVASRFLAYSTDGR